MNVDFTDGHRRERTCQGILASWCGHNIRFMKKILMAILALLSGLAVYGQEKGDMYVAGIYRIGSPGGSNLEFSSTGFNYERRIRESPDMAFSAEFGYFVARNCALRAAFTYGLKRKTTTVISSGETSVTKVSGHSFLFSPAVSYYVRICDKFYYRPGAALSFGSMKDVFEGSYVPESSPNAFVFGFSFEPAAFEVKPISHLGIMFRVGACDFQTIGSQTSLELRLLAGAVGLQFYF